MQTTTPKETSFGQIIKNYAQNQGDYPYLEDARSSRIITYKMLNDLTQEWGRVFNSIAPASQAAILVDVADPLSFAVIQLSALIAGKRAVPVDPNGPSSDLARLSDLINGASVIVSDRKRLTDAPDIPVLTIDPETWLPPKEYQNLADTPVQPQTAGSFVLFTSGSTGTPKGVELPEKQLLYTARHIAAHNKLTKQDRGFNSLPLIHVNAEVVALLSTLVSGSTMVLDQRFHREEFWELLAERRITWLNAVPSILAILVRGDAVISLPPTLRFIRSSSAPLPDVIRQALPNVTLVACYGMTEAAAQIAATPLGAPRRPGSSGVPVGLELEIRDAEGKSLPPGHIGAVWVKGEGVVTSYMFGRAPERFDENGWLSTGDIGKQDEDGYVYLMGRSDDVINRGGEKIYPAEIEDIILQDDDIREAVATAKSDEILGQIPVVYAITVQADLTQQAKDKLRQRLLEHCETHLARFKRPADVIVVDDLPRAPAGKVQRVKVRAMAEDYAIAGRP